MALSACVMLACTLQLASADGPRYDRGLEAAAIRIVAAKLGDIRGSLDADHRPTTRKPAGPGPLPTALVPAGQSAQPASRASGSFHYLD